MSKTAILALNATSNKWEAIFAGKVLASSPDKKYIIDVITKGLNGKARAMGVTKLEELGAATAKMAAHTAPLIEFDINERFEFLGDRFQRHESVGDEGCEHRRVPADGADQRERQQGAVEMSGESM